MSYSTLPLASLQNTLIDKLPSPFKYCSQTSRGGRAVLPRAAAAPLHLHRPRGREPRTDPKVPGDGGRGGGREEEDGRGQVEAERAGRQLRERHLAAAGADLQGEENIKLI